MCGFKTNDNNLSAYSETYYNVQTFEVRAKANADLGDRHRILEYGEKIEKGDEWFSFNSNEWLKEEMKLLQEDSHVGEFSNTTFIYRRKIKKSKKLKGFELIKAAVANAARLYEDDYMYFKMFDNGHCALMNEYNDMIVELSFHNLKRDLRRIAAATSIFEVQHD